jgi:hypothetical protein
MIKFPKGYKIYTVPDYVYVGNNDKLHDTTFHNLSLLPQILVDNMPTYMSLTKFFLWAYAIWGSYLKTEDIIDQIEANGNNSQLLSGHDVITLRWRSYEIRQRFEYYGELSEALDPL